MKINKKIAIGVFLFMLLGVGVINGIFPLLNSSAYQRSIFNNDTKIVSQADSYSYSYRKGINEDTQTNLEFKLTGMDTICELIADKDLNISMDYDSKISRGKFKVVLISPDNEINTLLEQSEQSTNKKVNIKKGKNRIKIIGRGAKGKLKLNVDVNNSVKLNPINSFGS